MVWKPKYTSAGGLGKTNRRVLLTTIFGRTGSTHWFGKEKTVHPASLFTFSISIYGVLTEGGISGMHIQQWANYFLFGCQNFAKRCLQDYRPEIEEILDGSWLEKYFFKLTHPNKTWKNFQALLFSYCCVPSHIVVLEPSSTMITLKLFW